MFLITKILIFQDNGENSTDTTVTAQKTLPPSLSADASSNNADLSTEASTQDASCKISEDLENMEGFAQYPGNDLEDPGDFYFLHKWLLAAMVCKVGVPGYHENVDLASVGPSRS